MVLPEANWLEALESELFADGDSPRFSELDDEDDAPVASLYKAS